MKDGSCAKVDKFDDVAGCHDTVIKFEITMSETDRVEIVHAFANLAEDAVYFGTAHLLGHDDAKEVIGGILHYLDGEGGGVKKIAMM